MFASAVAEPRRAVARPGADGRRVARRAGALDRLDLAISRLALGKDSAQQGPVESRRAVVARLTSRRPWLRVVVTDAQLITDIAADYDVVVMGADKWAQVRDPAWYD